MKAEIKNYYSAEIDNLENYKPDKLDSFCFTLQLFVGPIGEEIEEHFEFFVCTPQWLLKTHNTQDIFFGKNYIFVFEYNFEKIINRIKKLLDNIEEDKWETIKMKLARYGYQEPKNCRQPK